MLANNFFDLAQKWYPYKNSDYHIMKWDSATILWRRPLKKIKYLSRSDLAQPFLHSKYLVKQKSIGSWLKKTPFWIRRLARLVHTSEEHITNSFQLQRKGTYSKEVIIIASRNTTLWNEPRFLSRMKVTFIINEVFRKGACLALLRYIWCKNTLQN